MTGWGMLEVTGSQSKPIALALMMSSVLWCEFVIGLSSDWTYSLK